MPSRGDSLCDFVLQALLLWRLVFLPCPALFHRHPVKTGKNKQRNRFVSEAANQNSLRPTIIKALPLPKTLSEKNIHLENDQLKHRILEKYTTNQNNERIVIVLRNGTPKTNRDQRKLLPTTNQNSQLVQEKKTFKKSWRAVKPVRKTSPFAKRPIGSMSSTQTRCKKIFTLHTEQCFLTT